MLVPASYTLVFGQYYHFCHNEIGTKNGKRSFLQSRPSALNALSSTCIFQKERKLLQKFIALFQKDSKQSNKLILARNLVITVDTVCDSITRLEQLVTLIRQRADTDTKRTVTRSVLYDNNIALYTHKIN